MRFGKNRIHTVLLLQVVAQFPPGLEILKIVKGTVLHTQHDHIAVLRKVLQEFLVMDERTIALGKQPAELVAHLHVLHLVGEEHREGPEDHEDPGLVTKNSAREPGPHVMDTGPTPGMPAKESNSQGKPS